MNEDRLTLQKAYLADKLKGSTILISGTTGLIGSRIVYYLADLNDSLNAEIKIIALYRNEEKKNTVYADAVQRSDIEFVLYRMEDGLALDIQSDYIIHCAGISGGTKMHLKNPELVFETAYNGTKELLDYAVRSAAKHFVYVSSYEIYGSISSDIPIKENDKCALDTLSLRNIYAEAKRFCESLCTAFSSKYDIKISIGRLTSTFGNGVDYNDPRFFAEFARCIIEERDIVLKSTGGTVRNYLDSDDSAAAFLYILVNGENCIAYNLTNMDNKISIKSIAEKIIEVNRSDIKLKFDIAEDITKLGFRKEGCTLVDADRLYKLGWGPVYNIEDTLIKLVDYMRNHKNNK